MTSSCVFAALPSIMELSPPAKEDKTLSPAPSLSSRSPDLALSSLAVFTLSPIDNYRGRFHTHPTRLIRNTLSNSLRLHIQHVVLSVLREFVMAGHSSDDEQILSL